MTIGQRTAGTAGLITAFLFILLLAASFGFDPKAFTDAEAALRMARERAALKAVVGVATTAAAASAILFFSGLGTMLASRAPTRGSAVRLFGAIGAAALALGTLNDWIGVGYLAGVAAKDQIAAQHGWVALMAVNAGAYSVAGFFIGAAVLATTWAVIGMRTLGRIVGWIGVTAAVAIVAAVVAQAGVAPDSPMLGAMYPISGGLLLLWFSCTGMALRRGQPEMR